MYCLCYQLLVVLHLFVILTSEVVIHFVIRIHTVLLVLSLNLGNDLPEPRNCKMGAEMPSSVAMSSVCCCFTQLFNEAICSKLPANAIYCQSQVLLLFHFFLIYFYMEYYVDLLVESSDYSWIKERFMRVIFAVLLAQMPNFLMPKLENKSKERNEKHFYLAVSWLQFQIVSLLLKLVG